MYVPQQQLYVELMNDIEQLECFKLAGVCLQLATAAKTGAAAALALHLNKQQEP